METLIDLLRETSTQYADRTAVVYRVPKGPPVRWSYGELAERSRRAAAWLRNEGIAPGDRVMPASTALRLRSAPRSPPEPPGRHLSA